MSEKANPVGWFEIPVTDMSRAKAFYEFVFEFPIEEQEMEPPMAFFPMSKTAVGAAGALVSGPDAQPSAKGILIYFTAPDIEAVLSRVRKKGGKVISEKTSIGQYGFIALIQDTEGNRIGLHSME